MPNLLDNFITRRDMFRVGATSVGAYTFSPLLQTQARAAQPEQLHCWRRHLGQRGCI